MPMRIRMQRAPQLLFPHQYQAAVWLPAVLITFGIWMLEDFTHSRHTATGLHQLPAILFGFLPSFWEGLYTFGYLLYFAPLAVPAVRLRPGLVRRVLIGFLLEVLIGGAVLLLIPAHLHLIPCLHVANTFFIFQVLRRDGHKRLQYAALAAFILIALSTLLTQRHDPTDALVGFLLGWIAFKIAFAKELHFLDKPHPWEGISYELTDLYNLFVANVRENWETTYSIGQWEFLQSRNQRPRHYTIAGLIHDRFPRRVNVLDVGCGYGTLYALLNRQAVSYTGIDLAAAAIAECLKTFRGDTRCAFHTASFESFKPDRKFDVVVLNEVLYYFPLGAVEDAIHRARELLTDQGILIISMNRNFKAAWIWRKLGRFMGAEQSIRVRNMSTGSYWTVNVYPAAAIDSGLVGKLRGRPSGGISGFFLSVVLKANDELQRRKFERRFRTMADHARYGILEFEKRRFNLMTAFLQDRTYGNVLEAGCAEGHFTFSLAGIARRVIALDFSKAALARAKGRLNGLSHVYLVEADLRSWEPDPGVTFDLIVMSEILYCLGERNDLLKLTGSAAEDCMRPVLEKLAALLRPKGRILLAHNYAKGQRRSRELYRRILERMGLQLVREEDVPPTGEEGTDQCLVSLLEKPVRDGGKTND